MNKNKLKNTAFVFWFMLILFSLPGYLRADVVQPLQPFFFAEQIVKLLPFLIVFWPITVVVLVTLVKVWLIKRKLALPWALKPMEKLFATALGETLAEIVFLTFMTGLLNPIVKLILGDIGLTTAAAKGLYLIILIGVAAPLSFLFGTILILVLFNLFTSVAMKELRRLYLKTSMLLSLLLPVFMVLLLAARILFFK